MIAKYSHTLSCVFLPTFVLTVSKHRASSGISLSVKRLNLPPFIDCLVLFEPDRQNEGIVLVGEIGGTAEEQAAEYIPAQVTKPIVGYIAGVTASPGKRMGHAGAMISGEKGTAEGKIVALKAVAVHTVASPAQIGAAMVETL